jgi:hypothetical protein
VDDGAAASRGGEGRSGKDRAEQRGVLHFFAVCVCFAAAAGYTVWIGRGRWRRQQASNTGD